MITPRQLYFYGMGTGAMLVISIDCISSGDYWHAGLALAVAIGVSLWMITTTRPLKFTDIGQPPLTAVD